jgi:hypothetical protein
VLSHRALAALTSVIALLWVVNAVVGWIDPTRRQDTVSAAFMFVLAILYRGLQRKAAALPGAPDAPDDPDDPDAPDPQPEDDPPALNRVRRALGDLVAGEAPAPRRGQEDDS